MRVAQKIITPTSLAVLFKQAGTNYAWVEHDNGSLRLRVRARYNGGTLHREVEQYTAGGFRGTVDWRPITQKKAKELLVGHK